MSWSSGKVGAGDDPSEGCVWAPSSSKLGLGMATATGGSSSSSTLRDRVVGLVVVMIAGALQVTVVIDDNAGAGDGRHCHRRRSWRWWRVVAVFVIDTGDHRDGRRCCVKVMSRASTALRAKINDGVCSGHDGFPSTHLSCCRRRRKVEDASFEGF